MDNIDVLIERGLQLVECRQECHDRVGLTLIDRHPGGNVGSDALVEFVVRLRHRTGVAVARTNDTRVISFDFFLSSSASCRYLHQDMKIGLTWPTQLAGHHTWTTTPTSHLAS
jgi:hypothetical protein